MNNSAAVDNAGQSIKEHKKRENLKRFPLFLML